jgi:hypothetical protein
MTRRQVIEDFLDSHRCASVALTWSDEGPEALANFDRAVEEAKRRRNEALIKLNEKGGEK